MSRQRTWTDEQLIEAVKSVKSMRACIHALGLMPTGGNYSHIQSHIARLKLDTTHWMGQGWREGSTEPVVKGRPLDEVLVENKYTKTSGLRERLIREGLLENKCSICGITEWMGKSLVFQLDHINGKNDDNRIENLRLVCPNCDSQQETFRGKNKRLKREARDEALLRSLGLIE